MAESLAQSAAEKRTFHTLDGLRGVAAILVAALHYGDLVKPLHVGSGYLAVDIFFVMSGFVLALAYEARLRSTMSAGRFLVLRLVRLYPLYILGTLIGIVIPLAGVALGLSRGWEARDLILAIIPALLLLPVPPAGMTGSTSSALATPALYPFNAPAWSLSFEVVINVVYAATIRLPQRTFMPAILTVSGAGVIATAFGQGLLQGGWVWTDWWVGLVRVTWSFFLGVLFYRLYSGGGLPKLRFPPILALAAVAVLMCISVPDGTPRALYDALCVVVLFPLLVWLCICNEPTRGVRIYAVLGLISYPLYVIHVPIRYLVERVVIRVVGGNPEDFAPWIGVLVIAGLVALSWVLAATYDIWARQRLGRLVGQRPPKVP